MDSCVKDGEQPLVSVIMPVYCVEPYVGAAIQSVRDQAYDNWELICVVNGCPDGSSAICMEYVVLDQRITVVQTHNAGVGAARNRGITFARGSYIYFLDSDDMLAPDTLKTCVQAAQRNNADAVQFEARVLVEDGRIHRASQYMRSRSYEGVWNGADLYLRQMHDKCYFAPVWLYLTRTSLCFGQGVLFSEGVIHEDEYATYAMLMRAQRVVCLRDKLLIRRYRPNSIMTKRNWRASTRGYFVAYATVFGKGECGSGGCVAARQLFLERQSRSCVKSFYRTGLLLREFEAVVCAQQNEQAALQSLLSSRWLNPRWFAVLRMAFRAKVRMSEAKTYVESLLGSSSIAQQHDEREQEVSEGSVTI